MSFESAPVPGSDNSQYPGAMIDNIMLENQVVLARPQDVYLREFAAIPQLYLPLAQTVARQVSDVQIETMSKPQDTAAVLSGMHCAYTLARKAMVPETTPQMSKWHFQHESLLRGAAQYRLASPVARQLAEECHEVVDMSGTNPQLTRSGILVGLYMLDLGERHKQDVRLRRAQDQELGDMLMETFLDHAWSQRRGDRSFGKIALAGLSEAGRRRHKSLVERHRTEVEAAIFRRIVGELA